MRGEDFVNWLEGLKGEKVWTRARAALRRSLAFEPGTYPAAMPYVEPLVHGEGWAREAHYLVAALYAQKDGAHQSGSSLARALRERVAESQSVERRLLALLDADRDQIAVRLRHTVALVEEGIDFAGLLDDLIHWFDNRRYVQARWAREFYGRTGEEGKGDTEVTA